MLNKAQLEVAMLASGEQSRFTLNGILVTPSETVETDGHQLVRVGATIMDPESFPRVEGCTPTNDFKPFILPKADALAIAKALPRKTTIPVLDYAAIGVDDGNGFACLAVTDLERSQIFRPKKLDGQFPDWDRCMRKKEDAKVVVEFNAALLANVLNFIVRSTDRGQEAVSLRFYEDGGSVRIDSQTADIQAMVMPIRGNDVPHVEELPAPVYFEADTAQHVTILGMIGKVVTLLAGQFFNPDGREVIGKLGAFITDLASRTTIKQKEPVQ